MRAVSVLLAGLWMSAGLASGMAQAASCDEVARALNRTLPQRIDAAELADVLQTLNRTRDARLPDKFVTKREAGQAGWVPGRDLWSVPGLRGKSMGGDHFGNREGRLPRGQWREADLDYRGGRRGAKRLVFNRQGNRYVTVNHYSTFHEVGACQ